MKELQLTLAVANEEQIKRSWAFAVDTSKPRRKSLRDINRCVITAASREARAFGVRAGMAIDEARLLMPELKVSICNWSNSPNQTKSRLFSAPDGLKSKFSRSTYTKLRLPQITSISPPSMHRTKAQNFGWKGL